MIEEVCIFCNSTFCVTRVGIINVYQVQCCPTCQLKLDEEIARLPEYVQYFTDTLELERFEHGVIHESPDIPRILERRLLLRRRVHKILIDTYTKTDKYRVHLRELLDTLDAARTQGQGETEKSLGARISGFGSVSEYGR